MKHILIFITLLTSASSSFSQESDSVYLHPRYQLRFQNIIMAANTYEFDIYLRQTASSHDETVMLYGSCQYFIKFNLAFLGGGTMTASMLSSDLQPSLQPPSVSVVTGGVTGPLIQLFANLPTTPQTTDTIKYMTP